MDLIYAQDNKGSPSYQHDQSMNDFAQLNAQLASNRNHSVNDSDHIYAQVSSNDSIIYQFKCDYAQTNVQFSPASGQTKHGKSHTCPNNWNWHVNLKVSILTPFSQASLI